jgi:hypothetical protein
MAFSQMARRHRKAIVTTKLTFELLAVAYNLSSMNGPESSLSEGFRSMFLVPRLLESRPVYGLTTSAVSQSEYVFAVHT